MANMFEPGALKKYTPDRLDQLKLSCSTFMLYLGVNKVYDIPHHNIFFTSDYKSNIDDIVKNRKLSPQNSFYIQNAVVSDQDPLHRQENLPSTFWFLSPRTGLG